MQQAFSYHNAPITDTALIPVRAPAQPIGRNRELGNAHQALKAGSAVLIHGPAGVGKSTLAAVLAAANIAKNPGGVLWFNLIEDDMTQLLSRVARAHGLIALPDSNEKQRNSIKSLLEKKRPMIVLDGLPDIKVVAEFVEQVAPGIPLLVNSVNQAIGKWIPIPLGPLTQVDSTALLRSLSGMKSQTSLGDMEALARLLKGDPLALTLAGRHMGATQTNPAEFLSAMQAPTGSPDPQQQALDVLFRKLPAQAQGVFLILAASFAGGAGAELMVDMTGLPAESLAPTLTALQQRGLIEETISYGQPHYQLHESVQAFARRYLDTNKRLKPTEGRALRSVVNYARRHGHDRAADHDRLAAEIDNIMGAAAYATDNEMAQPLTDLTSAIGTGAGTFAVLRGFQTELNQLRELQSLLTGAPIEVAPPPARPEPIAPPEPVIEHKIEAPDPEPIAPPTAIPEPLPIQIIPEPEVIAPEPDIEPEPVAEIPEPEVIPPPEPDPEPSPLPIFAPPTPEPKAQVPPPPVIAPPPDPEPIKPLFFGRIDPLPEPVKPRAATPTAVIGDSQPMAPPDEWATLRDLSIPDLRNRVTTLTDKRTIARAWELLGDKVAALDGPVAALDEYKRSVEAWRVVNDDGATANAMRKLGDAYTAAAQTDGATMTYRLALTLAGRAGDDHLKGDLAFRLGRSLIDDQRTLMQGHSLLKDAIALAPDNDDARRLYKRADQRIQHLTKNGTALTPAIDNMAYAAQSVIDNIPTSPKNPFGAQK